jgi:hypothetical protein
MAEGRDGELWERKAWRGEEKKLSEGREGKCWPPIPQTISAIRSRRTPVGECIGSAKLAIIPVRFLIICSFAFDVLSM